MKYVNQTIWDCSACAKLAPSNLLLFRERERKRERERARMRERERGRERERERERIL